MICMISWVGSALHRSCTRYHNEELDDLDDLSDLSDLSVRGFEMFSATFQTLLHRSVMDARGKQPRPPLDGDFTEKQELQKSDRVWLLSVLDNAFHWVGDRGSLKYFYNPFPK